MTTQNLGYEPGATKYYKNCRGQNFLPPMKNEWEKSGYLPRIDDLNPGLIDGSAYFRGTNKCAQWWFYDHEDNERAIQQLRSLGTNAVRVFTDMYVWASNKTKYWESIKDFHKICDKHKMRVQWVLWDGVQVAPVALEPSNRAETVSSLEHGLRSAWRKIPHSFEFSSTAQVSSFFTTCATPYVIEFAQNVSSFQSLWSFDLCNEPSDDNMIPLSVSTGALVSSLLSSIGIGITLGHGNTYDPFPKNVVLGTGLGLGPGDTYLWTANYIEQVSSVITFGSIHPYATDRYGLYRYIDLAISGANIIGKPGMASEQNLDPYLISSIREYDYGMLNFDGLIDAALSYEPFLSRQGEIFWDGQVKNRETALAYVHWASSTGWFSNSQLMLDPVEKVASTNGGLDGGYVSSVIPEHQEFRPNIYVSANETVWNTLKTLAYVTYPNALIYNPTYSKNFAGKDGSPYSISKAFFTSETIEFPSACRYVLSYSSLPPLSSLALTKTFAQMNEELAFRNTLLSKIPLTLFDFILFPQLVGSQFDVNPIPSSLRYSTQDKINDIIGEFYWRGDLSEDITPSKNDRTVTTISSTNCFATSSCLYNTPGDLNSGIDWAAYDELYLDAFSGLKECINYMVAAKDQNPRNNILGE